MVGNTPPPDLLLRPERESRGGGLYAFVVDAIGQGIVDGAFEAGSILSTDELCATMNVSRSVMREALRTLSSMGLVEARPQVGTRVLPTPRWDLLNPRIITWRGKSPGYEKQHHELLELRLGIEPVAARLSASRMSGDEREEILASALRMRECIQSGNLRGFFEADALFHRLLVEGSGNAVIAKFADTIAAVLEVRSGDSRRDIDRHFADSTLRHIELAEALIRGDADETGQKAFELVNQTLQEFRSLTST